MIDDSDAQDINENPFENYWMEGDSLAPPCQAEMDVVDAIIDFAELKSDSRLYDLGCGDGRICIRASQRFLCQTVGCEIEETLIARFKSIVAALPMPQAGLVTVVHGDLLELDLSAATVIVIYLLPDAVEIIKPRLIRCLESGAVLICNTWGPKGLTPIEKRACGFCNNVNLLKYDASSIPAGFTMPL